MKGGTIVNLIATHSGTDGVRLETTEGIMHIAMYTPGIARIRYTLNAELSGKESLMVVSRPEAESVEWTVEEHSGHLEISTVLLKIKVDKLTCAFSYWDADGRLLTREPSRGGKTLERTEVYHTVFDASADTVETGQGADGLRARAEGINRRLDREAFHTKLEFEWQEGEALYGLGSHEEGMMNLRGRQQYLYQQNMKAVVPVLVSTRGYGILVDSGSYMTFHDDAFGSYLWSDADEEMDYYFIYGPEFDQITGESVT